jgi:hypothetical protein
MYPDTRQLEYKDSVPDRTFVRPHLAEAPGAHDARDH